MKDKKEREKKRVLRKGRIALSIALSLVVGISLSFAVSVFSSYILADTSQEQTTKVVIDKSPLIWRTPLDSERLTGQADGERDYLLSELAADGTYELTEEIETANQIETITVTWKSKGEVSLQVSVNNGQDYTPVVYGVPLDYRSQKSEDRGQITGNQIKWRATLGPDSELTEVRIAYTDTSGTGGTFGTPELSRFKFRKRIVIARSDSDEAISEELFNYQIPVLVSQSTDTSTSGVEVGCEGMVRSDFADIRFTAADGETLLAHYLESITGDEPNRIATYYVKFPQIPEGGLPIYIYYGNPDAESLSSGEDVFDFFNDFTQDELDAEKWETHMDLGGSYELSDSQLKLDGTKITSRTYWFEDGIIEYQAKAESGFENRLIIRAGEGNFEQVAYSSAYQGAEHCIAIGDIVKANQAKPISAGVTYRYKAEARGDELTFTRYSILDTQYSIPEAEVSYIDEGGLKQGYIGLKTGEGSVAYYDWLRVRKFAETEPYISASGDEEEVDLAQFSGTTLANNGNIIASSLRASEGSEAISTSTYTTALVSTTCDISVITPTIICHPERSEESEADGTISIDISSDGGLNWKEDCENARTYRVPFDFTMGRELLLRANFPDTQDSIPDLSSEALAKEDTQYEIEQIKLDYSIAPIVTSANVYVSGATGPQGLYQFGDTMVVKWDNSAAGDNNPNITSASCNFEPFGGKEQAEMVDENNENIYTIIYKLPEDISTTANIFITVANSCGIATRDGHILSVDTKIEGREEKIEGREEKIEGEEDVEAKKSLKNLKKRYKIKFGEDEAEIGDFKTEDFRPYVKLKRWGEECYFSMEIPPTYMPGGNKRVGRNVDKVEWNSTDIGARFYKKERKGIIEKSHKFIKNENSGLEFEVVLNKKPATNVISLPFTSKGLVFYYQGPLTAEEISQGAIRPEEVVGSYAVYHVSKKDNEYGTGKAFHIYRPKLIDKNGKWIWAELDIDPTAKLLKITVDQNWLNKAAYPVIVDPEFGYTSIGLTPIPIVSSAYGSIFTGSAMTASLSTAYVKNYDTAVHKIKYAIYEGTALVGSTLGTNIPALSTGWVYGPYSSKPTLSALDYALVANADNSNIYMYYDTGEASQGVSQARTYADDWATTATFDTDTKMFSIYNTDTPTIIIAVNLDTTPPVASAPTSTAQILKSGDVSTSTVQSTEAGNIYLVKTETSATTQALIDSAVTANTAFLGKSAAVADTPYTITVAESLVDGLYDIVAVDNYDNVSSACTGWLTVDNTAPAITSITSTTNPAGDSITVTHTAAGGVAPVDKTVTYGTVLTNLAGPTATTYRRWITQNLGATNQATSADDATEPSAGWYWQFNRKQGFKHDGTTRTPSTAWDATEDNLSATWESAKDPCTLLLGSGWRLPTYTEYLNADAAPQSWANYNDTYASVLKLHAAGSLDDSTGALLYSGSIGYYWSSTQSSSTNGYYRVFNSSSSGMHDYNKARGFGVRCLTIDSFDNLGFLKVDNTITFTLTPTITEDNLTIETNDASPTYNGVALSWATADSGETYTATYTVAEGNTDQATPLQLTAVTLTDPIGNTGAAVNGTDVSKAIDANTPTNQDSVFAANITTGAAAAVTIASSGDATNNVWFAPAGTTTFAAGATMTTAIGTATSILAPATEGTYKLYVIDAAGNYSTASTATLTVDTTPPIISSVVGNSLHGAGDTIAISFNKPMDPATLTNALLQAGTSLTLQYSDDSVGYNSVSILTSQATVNWNLSNTVVTITLDEADAAAYLPADKYISITPALNALKDAYGNSAGITRIYSVGVISGETTTPTLTVVGNSINAAGDTIVITSDEVLESLSSQALSNWAVEYDNNTEASGEINLPLTRASISRDATGKIFTITLDESFDGAYIPDAQYVKVIPSVYITDLSGNSGVPAVYSAAKVNKESVIPTFTVSATSVDAGPDIVELTFSEAMDITTLATGCANLTINSTENTLGTGRVELTTDNAIVTWNAARSMATISLNEALDGAYIPLRYVEVVPNLLAITDLMGNAVSISKKYSGPITQETINPVITDTAPVTDAKVNSSKVSYTLSETCSSGSVTWTRTSGTADVTHVQALTVAELTSGAHNNIPLTNSPVLVNGAGYTITFAATDMVGNLADEVLNTNVIFDITIPAITSVSVASSNNVLTLAKAGDTVTYSINYNKAMTVSAASASIANNIAAAATTNVSASNALTDSMVFSLASGDNGVITPKTIYYTITDSAGNSSLITSLGAITGAVTADTTLPTVTSISTNLTNDTTGIISAGELAVTTVFSERMKIATVPTVAYDPAGPTGNQVCSAAACAVGGGWSTTTVANDTYKACNVNAIDSATGDGTAVINVSGTQDLASNTSVASTKNFLIITTILELKFTASGTGASGTALSSVTAGVPFDITVTAKDTLGNLKTGYTGTVKFETDDTHSEKSLPNNYTFTTADAGQKTFSGGATLITRGSKYIKATDTVYAVNTATRTITVNSAATVRYALSSPADITAGTRAAYTISRYDTYGNLQTVGADVIYLTSSSSGSFATFKDAAVSGNTLTTVMIVGGASSANFWYYDIKAGSWTITASDKVPADGSTGIVDATDELVVLPTSASKYKITSAQSTMSAGDSAAVTITAYDLYDNFTTSYGGATPGESKSLYFSGANASSSPVTKPKSVNNVGTAIDFGDTANCTFIEGVANTEITLYKAEGVAIKVHNSNPTDSVPTITTADSDDLEIVVNGGAASKLSWYKQPEVNVVARAPWKSFALSVTDSYGNVSPSSATVTVTPSSGVTLTPTCIREAVAQSGVATFNNFAVYSTTETYPAMVTLTASTSTATSSASNSASMVEKYTITLNVKDSVTLGSLTSVSLSLTDSLGNVIVVPTHSSPWTGNSPFTDNFNLPYGTYSISLEKDAYVPTTIDLVADTTQDGVDASYDNSLTWNTLMTSIAESMADYKVQSDFVYDEDEDKLKVATRLERRSQLVAGDNANALGTSQVLIYDGQTLLTTLTDTSPDDQGNYWFEVSDVTSGSGSITLVSGKSYFSKCSLSYGGTDGDRTTYHSGTTFDIGISARIKTWTEEIRSDVSGVKADVEAQAGLTRTAVTSAKTSIESEVATKATATQANVTSKATETMTLIGSEDLIAGETLASTLSRESASRILNQESFIKQRDTLTVRYKTDTGLSPVINVYDANNILKITDGVMTEAVSGAGIYEYDVAFSWGRGEHTIVCKETTKGTLDGINIEVISTDLEDISTTGTTTMAQLANIDTDQMEMLSGSIADINGVISRVVSNIDELAGLSAKVRDLAGETTTAIYEQLEVAAQKLEEINKGQGVKIEKMYDLSEEQSTDMDYVKNKTLEIKALTELTQAILSRTSDVPVVKTWMESGE